MVDEVNQSDVDAIAAPVINQILASLGCILTGGIYHCGKTESNDQLMHNNALSAETQRLTSLGICDAQINKWVQAHVALSASTRATDSEALTMITACAPAAAQGAPGAPQVGVANIEFAGTPTKNVDSVTAGGIATITVKFKNTGDAPAAGVYATAYIDGTRVGTSALFSIGKGSTATAPIQITAPSVTKCEDKRVVIKTSV